MECEIVKCETTEYESELSPTPVESDLVQVYDSIDQITNPNSNHVYVVGNDIYVFDGTRFLHTNDCNIPPYTGEYTVTAPSTDDLVLPTNGKFMEDDLTIEANHEIEDALIQNTPMDEYINDRITKVVGYKFYATNFKVINLPNVTTAGNNSFGGNNASTVEEIYLPRLSGSSGNYAWESNPNLRILDIGQSNSVNVRFRNCPMLTTLIIRRDDGIIDAPTSTASMSSTPFAPDGAGGDIYVPQSVLSNYQNSQSWADYASANITFHAIEGSIYELEE